MKKRVWSLVLIVLVAVCGMIFVACGQNPADRVSLAISSGLDKSLSEQSLSQLSNELSLSESERTAISQGMGYDAKIPADKGDVVTLVVGSQVFGSREIIVRIDGYEENMSKNVHFSSDSSAVSFSVVEYLAGGKAKVVITGVSAGTAEVYARSAQYSKQVSFTVKVIQKPESIAVKENAVIYLERGKKLTINPEDYVNFYPNATNMKDLLFYKGSNLLTVNGVTTLSGVASDDNAITQDTLLTIRSPRIVDGFQTITVRLVDSISNIGVEKLVYRENQTDVESYWQTINAADKLTVIKNSSKKYINGGIEQIITYGIREIYVVVQNNENNLYVNAQVYIAGSLTDILALQTDHERVTDENVATSKYGEMIAHYIGDLSDFSFHVFKFEFQYSGYDAYDVKFNFGVENYIYSNSRTLSVEFKNASDIIEFRKYSEDQGYNEYTIYDSYEGVYGTRFIVRTNIGAFPYSFELDLSEAGDGLIFRSATGQLKLPTDNILKLTSGESFYILGNSNNVNSQVKLIIRITYNSNENIVFETTKEITFNILRAPDTIKFFDASINELTEYNFDLNTSGVRVGETDPYNAKSEIKLDLLGFLLGNPIGDVTDFTIVNNSQSILVTRDPLIRNRIILTALGVGTGTFTIILGNNLRATFNFEVVHSVSEFQISFPTEEQNKNVFSLIRPYEYNDEIYENHLIAIRDKSIPLIVNNKGDIQSIGVSVETGGAVSYSNSLIKTSADFERKVASVSITYKYIGSDGKVKTTGAILASEFLLSSMTKISNFNLTTSKNSTNFTLYDYSSVGYYSRQMSTVNVYLTVLPTGLSSDILKNKVQWVTNRNWEHQIEQDNETIYYLKTDVFEFTYYKNTGTATLLCNVLDEDLYNENGVFADGKIVLTAKIDREEYGVHAKSFQFDIVKNNRIDVIVPSVNEINLDDYSKEYDLFVNVYPLTAANQSWIYEFIPSEGLVTTDIGLEMNNDGSLKVSLNGTNKSGRGILRIIAVDSFATATEYSKFIDIPVTVSDGSYANPYQIASPYDVRKMIGTDFAKHYIISGNINLSLTDWDFNEYILRGTIRGINNAQLSGFNISNVNIIGNEIYCGLFKEIELYNADISSISNIKINGSIGIDLTEINWTNKTAFIGLLAAKNSGILSNVYVEHEGGNIFASTDYTMYIGGVAGINTGIIETIISADSTYTRGVYFKNYLNFVDTSDSPITHSLYIGGVAGWNNGGIIARYMESELVDINNSFATAEVYIRAYYSNNLLGTGTSQGNEGIGGICGLSSNQDGGLLGVSSYGEISAGRYNNVSRNNEWALTYTSGNNVFYGNFNNVGGLVGDNRLPITVSTSVYEIDPEVGVFVRGKSYVGGAVGKNSSSITNIRVEALEVAEGSGYKTGLNTTLIVGEDYIGGLAGANSGNIVDSYFISYINRNLVPYNSAVDKNKYFGDIVIMETIGNVRFGALIGSQAGNADRVVSIANVQFTSLKEAQNTLSILEDSWGETVENYAVYVYYLNQNNPNPSDVLKDIQKVYIDRYTRGDAPVIDESQALLSVDNINELQGLLVIENAADEKIFNFIYLLPNQVGIELKTDGLTNEMTTDDTNDDLAFYLFYYEMGGIVGNGIDNPDYQNAMLQLQNIMLGMNIYDINSFIGGENPKYTLTCSEPSILEISKNGKFIVKGTGLVTITARTPYNIGIEQKIYVYIVNYTNNINAHLTSTKRDEIKDNSNVTFDATDSVMIYFSFLDKYNIYNLKVPTDVLVMAKVGESLIKIGDPINESIGFRLLKVSADAYQFVVNGTIIGTLTNIQFIPYIEFRIGDKIYSTVGNINELVRKEDPFRDPSEIEASLRSEVSFKYKIINTTKSINLSKNSITTEPYFETSVDVILNSLNDNEVLTIRISLIDNETGLIDSTFNPNWLKVIAVNGAKVVENGSKNSRTDLFRMEGDNAINAKINNKIVVTFRFEDEFRDLLEKKIFVITFITSNNKSAQLTLTYNPQKVINIVTTLYPLQSITDNQYNFPGDFSYIPTTVLTPGQVSLIDFNIIPYFTKFSTIEVVNLASNPHKLVFNLFDRTSQNTISGATTINMGISIDKSLTDQGRFYLRVFLDEAAADNSTVSIQIILRDSEGNEVAKITKDFFVEHMPGVKLIVDGVSSGNEEGNPVKLARGVTYDLGVWVKGFNGGNLTMNSSGEYIDGDLHFVVSNPNLVSIVKNNDGTYRLVVTGNSLTTNRYVRITTYGEKIVNGERIRSKDAVIYLEIVEFVVKNSGIGDIINGVIDGIYSSAVGNNYQFDISLNSDMLIYDRTSTEILNKVLKFLQEMSTGISMNEQGTLIGKVNVWAYQDQSGNLNSWATVSSNNTSFKPIGSSGNYEYKTPNNVFTLKYNSQTQIFSVLFMRSERTNNPSFKFKYETYYYYTDIGLPKLKTIETKPSYRLTQTFMFDITERTTIRNPYPVYTYEDLIDMREGNYYILLADITLPSDFMPITTLIGGLDGNNHKIIIPNLDILNSRGESGLYFGLFSRTSNSSLLNNIILYVNGNININIYDYNAVVYGLLVGENNGQITNCAIEGENFPIIYLDLIGYGSSTTINNEVGALVGINNGNITNSRVEVGISVNGQNAPVSYRPANVGGIVAANKDGATIASSYVKARIENNTSSVDAKTGGIVAVNEFGAEIFTTYISGEYTGNYSSSLFANNEETLIIYTGASAGAFVYENWGTISNCYANIPMKATISSSGFVYMNKTSGRISYCYSTCLLEGDSGNSAFVGVLDPGGIIQNQGTIEECYALSENEGKYYFKDAERTIVSGTDQILINKSGNTFVIGGVTYTISTYNPLTKAGEINYLHSQITGNTLNIQGTDYTVVYDSSIPKILEYIYGSIVNDKFIIDEIEYTVIYESSIPKMLKHFYTNTNSSVTKFTIEGVEYTLIEYSDTTHLGKIKDSNNKEYTVLNDKFTINDIEYIILFQEKEIHRYIKIENGISIIDDIKYIISGSNILKTIEIINDRFTIGQVNYMLSGYNQVSGTGEVLITVTIKNDRFTITRDSISKTWTIKHFMKGDEIPTNLIDVNVDGYAEIGTLAEYNSGLGSNAGISGLSLISHIKFKEKSTFSKFTFPNTSNKTESIWFWPESIGSENGFIRNGVQMFFNFNKPELVAPNIIATGSKTFNYSEYNDETGITLYHYNQDPTNYEGTKFNPYLITTTEDIEFIKQLATNFVIPELYFRVVCDIVYETSTISSGLYRYSFLGSIEGNGFTIGNYVIDSAESLPNAGYFASIGTQSKQTGSLKNITFAPRYISLVNANSVGAVAGRVYSATLVNIKVDGFTYSTSTGGVVILGRNAVGGVVGTASGNFNFSLISSNISVNSTYRADLNGHNIEFYKGTNNNRISYSGLIAGVMDGYGNVRNVYVYGDNVAIAENASLTFGYVGKNVIAEWIVAESSANQSIKADAFGGIIAAHNDGTLKNITVTEKNNRDSFFIGQYYIPLALGNVVGYMTGGTIDTANVNAPLKANSAVLYVGGAVGLMHAGTLKNVFINGNIVAGSTIGGLIGYAIPQTSSAKFEIRDCFYNGQITSISSDSTVHVGSVIGYTSVNISNVKEIQYEDVPTYKINIITSDLFLENIGNKLKANTLNGTTIQIINYSSGSLKIWYGEIICVNNNNEEELFSTTNAYYTSGTEYYLYKIKPNPTIIKTVSSWKENGVNKP